MNRLDERIQQAKIDGLADLGFVVANEAATYPTFQSWLNRGDNAGMDWLARNPIKRCHPASILQDVKTILVAVLAERELLATSSPVSLKLESHTTGPVGEMLPYTISTDYHRVLRQQLGRLRESLATEFPDAQFRIAIDTAPLLEKEWGVRARLGTVGRHTLLIHPEHGSRVFLGFLLTSIAPEDFGMVDSADSVDFFSDGASDWCVGCDACSVACPTGALRGDRTLDARKCLNYWTMESHGETIPAEIREKLDGRLLGCDACQRACPRHPTATEPVPRPLPLAFIESLNAAQFDAIFSTTPTARVGLARLQRNARWIS